MSNLILPNKTIHERRLEREAELQAEREKRFKPVENPHSLEVSYLSDRCEISKALTRLCQIFQPKRMEMPDDQPHGGINAIRRRAVLRLAQDLLGDDWEPDVLT